MKLKPSVERPTAPFGHQSFGRTHDIPVSGGTLRLLQSGNGPRVVLGLHGLAGSHRAFDQLAQGLDDRYTFLAPDLRGRGTSSGLPGPFGINAHAEDCARILDYLAVDSAVVVGHSMGAVIAERLAAQRPELVRGVVLIDGGLPFPVEIPADGNMESLIHSVVGPVLENLRRVFTSEAEYLETWRNHPAFSAIWNDQIERRFRYEIVGEAPNIRSRVLVEAIKADSVDILVNTAEATSALEAIHCPLHLLRASRGILNQPTPLLSDDLVRKWTSQRPLLNEAMIPDTNHASIVILDHAIREIADRIRLLSE